MRTISFLMSALLTTSISFADQGEEEYGNLLACDYYDMASGELAGQTLLNLIRDVVKPELDQFATKGYPVASGDDLVAALSLVDAKVSRQALREVGGKDQKAKIANLKKIGDQLEGQLVNLDNLTVILKDTGLVAKRDNRSIMPYTLSTYVGLASCGGVTLKLANDNYAYNVHYNTGKDADGKYVYDHKKSGRSFGASRIFNAIDSSYTHYFTELQKFIEKTPEEAPAFVKTILEGVTNSQLRGYADVNDQGDAVLTDFFAIWTAEQTRNLMDAYVKPHWDAALFEVTLLSASIHAGQDKIKLYYGDPLTGNKHFTGKTYSLEWPKKNHTTETCDVDFENRSFKDASLKDYVGVHYRTYKNCRRSGVDTAEFKWTRKRLGNKITLWLLDDNVGNQLLRKVRNTIRTVVDLDKDERGKSYDNHEKDIYRELSRFIINQDAPSKVANWAEFSQDVTQLMSYVQESANMITSELEDDLPALKEN